MRKITRKMAEAFVEGRSICMSNTETHGHMLYLFGNNIAYIIGGTLYLTFAGWPTQTTRERLNGLLMVISTRYKWKCRPGFFQENYIQYFENSGNIRVVSSKEILALNLKDGKMIHMPQP